MATSLSITRKRLSVAASSFCCTLIFAPASFGQADPAPLSVEVSLASPATFSLGEPVVLQYKLSNLSSDEKLAVLSGTHSTSWYTLTLTDQAGNQVRQTPNVSPSAPSGYHAGDVSIYAAGDHSESYTVASKSISILCPGRYTLTVHVQAPYTLVAPPLENPVLIKAMMNSAGTVLNQDFSFPLNVTAANPVLLQAKANALREEISKEQSSARLLPEMDELFSMPEAQAGSIWEELAVQAKPMDRDLIADKVAGLRSNKAVDILFKMIDNPLSNSGFVSRRLSEVYNGGDFALREHIKSAAAQRGIHPPDKVNVPQVID